MTVQTTRWFAYGDPGSSDRVPGIVRTAYQTGPNEPSRPDDVEFGTIPVADLDALDEPPISDHVHSDGSILLSALPPTAEDELLAGWEPDPARQRIWDLISAGCSPTAAVDYLVTERTPIPQGEWAARRGGTSQQAVADAVRRAREALADDA